MSTGGYEEARAGLVAAAAVQALEACLSLLVGPPSVLVAIDHGYGDSRWRLQRLASAFVDRLRASPPGRGDLLTLMVRLQTEALLPTLSSRLDLTDLAEAERALAEILKFSWSK